MIEESPRVHKGFVKPATSPDVASHHSRSQVQHLFETARLFDFTIIRQIALISA